MLDAFQSSGGMLPADQVVSLMRGGSSQPVSRLARWIVDRSIVTVRCCGMTMVPLFQFEPGLDGLRPGLAAVLAELVDIFDDDEVADWFVHANHFLGGEPPADVLARDPCAVRDAARIDRFIAAG